MGEETFQVFAALPTEDVCTLRDLTTDMHVFQLKSRIELKTGIPGDIQRLHFMNKELYDDATLAKVNLKQGCIVRIKMDSNYESLFDACWRGDLYEVFQNGVQFLDESEFQGYNIALWNRLVVQRATHALFMASHRGYLGLVIELLNQSAADINGKTRFGRTSLHVAAYQGFVGCVSLLLSEGALCNQVDFNGKTALSLASENGHMYCERRLWLYQLSLNAFNEKRDNLESRKSQESIDNLRLSPKKSLAFRAKERLDSKELHFHLPRVQLSSGSTTSTPVHHKPAPRSQFPLMQIAEKYRKELQIIENSSIPDVQEGPRQPIRPKTAPGPSRVKLAAKRTGEQDIVDQVQRANVASTPKTHGDREHNEEVTCQSHDEQTDSVNDHSPTANKNNNDDTTPNTALSDKCERSSSGNVIRKLDVVISTSKEKYKQENPASQNETPAQLPAESQESANSEIFIDVSEQAYRRKKTAQTFEHWLEMKRNQNKLRPSTATSPPSKSKLGKSIDPEAFREWLSNKKQRDHSRSFSDSSSSPRKGFISSGLTFEEWLRNKAKAAKENHVNDTDENGGNTQKRARVANLAGKTYDEWLNEKIKQAQATRDVGNNQGEKNVSKSGKSFEVWLLEKRNQKQIEAIHKATTEKLEQKRLEFEQYQKYMSPHYKTFDEWLAIKKQENLIERFRAENQPKKYEEIPIEEREKDSSLVYSIWLTSKYVQEMQEEEKKYQEMVEKWKRKEQQRAQMKRIVLANRAKKTFIRNHMRAKSAEP
ncbi:ankyrin repeat domain-containing protein 50 [Nematostella vectensis]|uniref:ankyrin repeat domain-containing protein 50 n=1 Tax=Nematostella vectensis TaxID=45351 RepID=UPI00138FF7AD|nr:ankyrin repeat domain-containing protein 50 [Nematostella vectensis]XP_032227742.1 ankyrin repeat domain-containing protein 50 [Nematostella vectensis]XP_048577019.1 ankyrin repeat domain-containing protein 50 [Nematostella vectensis]